MRKIDVELLEIQKMPEFFDIGRDEEGRRAQQPEYMRKSIVNTNCEPRIPLAKAV